MVMAVTLMVTTLMMVMMMTLRKTRVVIMVG